MVSCDGARPDLSIPFPHTSLFLHAFERDRAATVKVFRRGRRIVSTALPVLFRWYHLLQGVFLFGLVLPTCILWKWPRPFLPRRSSVAHCALAAVGAVPLTVAENKLRLREGKAIIPPRRLYKKRARPMGRPAVGHAISSALHGIGVWPPAAGGASSG